VGRLISRDLRGTRFRTISVIISVAVLVSLFFSTSLLEIGVSNAAHQGAAKLGAQMLVLPPLASTVSSFETATTPIFVVEPTTDYLSGSAIEVFGRIPGIAAFSPQLYVATLNRSSPSLPVRFQAFDPKTDFVVRPWLNYPEDSIQGNQAVAGARTGYSAGDEITSAGLDLRVAAVLAPTNSSMDQTVFFTIQNAYSQASANSKSFNFKAGEVSGVLLKLVDGANPATVKGEIEIYIVSFRLVEASGLVSQVKADTTGIVSYELLVEIIMAISVLVMIGSIFSMTVNERSRQLGLLRSLGATKRFIFGNVVIEAALMAIAGGALGLVVGELIVLFGEQSLVVTFNIPPLQPTFIESVILSVTSVAFGIIVGTAASSLPAIVVSRRDPYDAIRRGD
jgi:putative ABC transport system permease protein